MNPGSTDAPILSPSKNTMKRIATWSGFVYFAAMTAALTFPGLQPFNTIRPFILGVPFVFAWYLFWIVGSLLVFLWLHRVYGK